MAAESFPDKPEAGRLLNRTRLSLAVFTALSILLFYGCYLLAKPFLPAVAWAMALAIIAHPLHKRIAGRLHREDLAASASVLAVAVLVVAPLVFLILTLAQQVSTTVQNIQPEEVQKGLSKAMQRSPGLSHFWQWLEPRLDSGSWIEQLTRAVGGWAKSLVTGSVWASINLLISFFLLFYFWRDRESVTAFLRSVLPLSEPETDEVFARVQDTVYASTYGTFAVAAVQGALGGLMFWWLGLPGPLLWGVVMGLLSIIPVLGAFVVWIPAAIFLSIQGHWGKAIILAVWGTVVIGLVDNILYPILVGKRLRLHTVPVFIAIVGGLIVFGGSGLILGPVVLALADAALEIWRRRTAPQATVAGPIQAGRAGDDQIIKEGESTTARAVPEPSGDSLHDS